ncbi:hypothetical protein [Chthonobacter rhizosphaerae]|uniref:hypothetical protein n=1 Tax=Chthonobacter rhizosphaerae TaxID=2735553 RepID=UPI0015EF6B1B|nr:hypothetical protein [Chthonobacter rhizosphaerae]
MTVQPQQRAFPDDLEPIGAPVPMDLSPVPDDDPEERARLYAVTRPANPKPGFETRPGFLATRRWTLSLGRSFRI